VVGVMMKAEAGAVLLIRRYLFVAEGTTFPVSRTA
jgi:hypothetical protein